MKTKTKNASEKGLQSRPEQKVTDNAPKIDRTLRLQNRALDTDGLLGLLRQDAPQFYEKAEVVGKWVWVRFEDKQPREVTCILSQLGFHWNNRRQVWQHPCGLSPEEAATADPRVKYGSYFAASKQAA